MRRRDETVRARRRGAARSWLAAPHGFAASFSVAAALGAAALGPTAAVGGPAAPLSVKDRRSAAEPGAGSWYPQGAWGPQDDAGRRAQRAASPGPTASLAAAEPQPFRLGGGRFLIDLPPTAQISADPGGSYAWIELVPGAEASPSIWLETPFDENQPFAFNALEELGAQSRLDYRASVGVDGVGERQAHLDGRLSLGAARWSVSCTLKHPDVMAADALWCLPYLRSVRAAP